MINHELIKYDNKLYFVYRKYHASHIKENKIHELMNLLECNIVLKKTQDNVVLYYLKEITDLEILN
jgi:hypothetical protein